MGRSSLSKMLFALPKCLNTSKGYYVPGESYRSTPEIEQRLESERQATINLFVAALRDYTNVDFGTDSSKWLGHLGTMGDGK